MSRGRHTCVLIACILFLGLAGCGAGATWLHDAATGTGVQVRGRRTETPPDLWEVRVDAGLVLRLQEVGGQGVYFSPADWDPVATYNTTTQEWGVAIRPNATLAHGVVPLRLVIGVGYWGVEQTAAAAAGPWVPTVWTLHHHPQYPLPNPYEVRPAQNELRYGRRTWQLGPGGSVATDTADGAIRWTPDPAVPRWVAVTPKSEGKSGWPLEIVWAGLAALVAVAVLLLYCACCKTRKTTYLVLGK